jgi:UDP-N-acetylglucosamine 2-epimerase (non-hydrolysing)
MKVLFVFGTRPEAIKLGPVIHHMKADGQFDVKVCITGQHREMLHQMLATLDIKPDVDLNLMSNSQTLAAFTGQAIKELSEVVQQLQPDVCFIQGDTSTSLAAALAAFYNKVPIAHVEAGLRTFSKYSPFPEEINRVLSSHVADIHFAPTVKAKENLLTERIREENIAVTGNTVIDTLHYVKSKLKSHEIEPGDKVLRSILNSGEKFIIVTAHRRENFGDGITSICRALQKFSNRYQDITVLFPVHLNPNIARPVREMLTGSDNIRLVEPLDYVDFVSALSNCFFVLTDSGGIQEEAPTFGKPVLIMRDSTERPEAVEAGVSKLVGTGEEKIFKSMCELVEDPKIYASMSMHNNPYGDGRASERIIMLLKKWMREQNIGSG